MMMRYNEKDSTIRFEAQRSCVLAGRRFRAGDSVDVFLAVNWDGQGDDFGNGGPWGVGGYTSRCLLRIADRITETGRGDTIFQR